VSPVREPNAVSRLDADTIVVAWTGSKDALVREVREAVREGPKRVVVDLESAELVDSKTLTALHRAARDLRASEGRLILVCADPDLASVLHLTLLDHSIDVVASRKQAMRPRR
jgi:anti-anti-sigma factor